MTQPKQKTEEQIIEEFLENDLEELPDGNSSMMFDGAPVDLNYRNMGYGCTWVTSALDTDE